jgi:2-dehydro-3-deoxyphosphogluconate aldolase/(4S)-4-hydroxy-2-oxoglutarate aldolase
MTDAHEPDDPFRTRVVPVLTIDDDAQAPALARALAAGGLPVIEVTLRTPVALEAIRRIAGEVEEAVVGAGTLIRPSDIDAALAAGARFLASPGTTPELAAAARAAGAPFLPGVATPGEAMRMAEYGFRLLKFFPAEAAGGTAALAAMAAPLAALRFCPTGGVDASNAAAYLALPNVAFVGGSWVAPREAVRAGDWDRIAHLARGAATLAGPP